MGISRVSNKLKAVLFNSKFILFCRIIIGFVFIYASIDKIANPLEFSDTIDNYQILPVAINSLIALILPWVELIIGVFLISGIYLKGTSILSTGLLLMFIILISQALYRGIDLHCGCFKTFVDPNFTDLRGEMIRRIGEDILLGIGSFLVSLTSLKKENIKE